MTFIGFAQTSDELLDKVPSYSVFGDFKEALGIINQAIEVDSTNARAYYERAKFVLMLKSIEDDYGETLKKDAAAKESAEIFELIGKEEVYDYVIKDATTALQLKNGYTEALEVRAEAYQRNGNIASAIDDLSNIIEIKPEDATAYETRGELLFSIGENDKALNDYSKVIEKSKHELPRLEAYYQRGKINVILERYAQAVADFTYLIDNGVSSEDVIFSRATALIGIGSFVDACEDYKKVRESNDITYRETYDSFDCDEHYLNRGNFKSKECKKFKTGKFKYSQYAEKDLYIVRTKNKQVEYVPSGQLVFDIKWISKTSYKLTYAESDLPSYKDKIGESIIVKITDVKGDAYTCEVVIDGRLFRSTFIKIGK